MGKQQSKNKNGTEPDDPMDDPFYRYGPETDQYYGETSNSEDIWIRREHSNVTWITLNDSSMTCEAGEQLECRETVLNGPDLPDHYDKINENEIYEEETDLKQPIQSQSNKTNNFRRRPDYEQMVKIFQPLIVANVIVRRLLPHLPFLTNTDRLRAIEERDPHAAVIYLIDELCSNNNTEPGRWKQFIHALETCGYNYIVATLRGQEPLDQTYQREYLRILSPALREQIDPLELLPVLWGRNVLSNEDKEEILHFERNRGPTAATDKLLDLVPRRHKYWYRHLVDALRNVGRTEVSDILAIPEIQGYEDDVDLESKKETPELYFCPEDKGYINDEDKAKPDKDKGQGTGRDSDIDYADSEEEEKSEAHLSTTDSYFAFDELVETLHRASRKTKNDMEEENLYEEYNNNSEQKKKYDPLSENVPSLETLDTKGQSTESKGCENNLDDASNDSTTDGDEIIINASTTSISMPESNTSTWTGVDKDEYGPPLPSFCTQEILKQNEGEDASENQTYYDDGLSEPLSNEGCIEGEPNTQFFEKKPHDVIFRGTTLIADNQKLPGFFEMLIDKLNKGPRATPRQQTPENVLPLPPREKTHYCDYTIGSGNGPRTTPRQQTPENVLPLPPRRKTRYYDYTIGPGNGLFKYKPPVPIPRCYTKPTIEKGECKGQNKSKLTIDSYAMDGAVKREKDDSGRKYFARVKVKSSIINRRCQRKFSLSNLKSRRKLMKSKIPSHRLLGDRRPCFEKGNALINRSRMPTPKFRIHHMVKDEYLKRKSLPLLFKPGYTTKDNNVYLKTLTGTNSLEYSEPFKDHRGKEDEHIFTTIEQVVLNVKSTSNQQVEAEDFRQSQRVTHFLSRQISDTDELLEILQNCKTEDEVWDTEMKSITEIDTVTKDNLTPELRRNLEKLRDQKTKLSNMIHEGVVMKKQLQFQENINKVLKQNRQILSELTAKEKEAQAHEAAMAAETSPLGGDNFVPYSSMDDSTGTGTPKELYQQFENKPISNYCDIQETDEERAKTTYPSAMEVNKGQIEEIDKDSAFYSEYTTKL